MDGVQVVLALRTAGFAMLTGGLGLLINAVLGLGTPAPVALFVGLVVAGLALEIVSRILQVRRGFSSGCNGESCVKLY